MCEQVVLEKMSAVTFTAVSNLFLDHYMPEANGEFVKVYLTLLRRSAQTDGQFTISALADQLNHTEKDVLRALRYWQKQGLLQLREENGEIEGIRLLPVPEITSGAEPAVPEPVVPAPVPAGTVPTELQAAPAVRGASPVRTATVSEEALSRLKQDEEFAQILFVAEQYLGRTLSPKDVRLLGYLYDELRFPEDLIEYLIEYCVGGGHRNNRYIETVALDWHADGIRTMAQAKEAHRSFSRETRQIMRTFGISGRVLTTEERAFLQKWRQEYGMPLEVVTEACARTMSAIHTPSFEYADSILTAWHAAGVTTLPEARTQAETHRKQYKRTQPQAKREGTRSGAGGYDQREMDYDALLAAGRIGG